MNIFLKNSLRTLGILLIINLAACSSSDNNDNNAPTAPASNNGVWMGDLTYEGEEPFPVIALLANGRIMIVPFAVQEGGSGVEENGAWSGEYTYPIEDDQIVGTATEYDFDDGKVLGDANEFYLVHFTGSVTESRFLFLDFEGRGIVDGEVKYTGTINLEFADDGRDGALSSIEGNWTLDPSGEHPLPIEVNADGSFEDTNTEGCELWGDISILDPEYNLFLAENIHADDCNDADGEYSGFASVSYDIDPNFLTILGANGDHFLYLNFEQDPN